MTKKNHFETKNVKSVSFQKMFDKKSLTWYLFKKWLTKKGLYLFKKRVVSFQKKKLFFLFTFFVYFLKQKMQSLYLFKKWLTKKTFLKGGPRHKQKMQSLCLFKKWLTKKNLFLFAFFVSKRFFLSTIF